MPPTTGHEVTELQYRGQKSKARKFLHIVDAFVKQLEDDEAVVESHAEKARIVEPLAKAEAAVQAIDEYIAEHEAWEFNEQKRRDDPEFRDEELHRQKRDHEQLQHDYVLSATAVNRLIKKFDKATSRTTPQTAASTSQQAQGRTATSPGGQHIVILREDDKFRLNDSLKPEKLSMNDEYLVYIQWERAVKAYFQMNTMEKKERNIQVSAFYGCLDDSLVRDVSIHFSSLPETPLMDLNVPPRRNDTYLDYVGAIFQALHPKACRILSFFTEVQAPSETASQYLARVESLSVAAEVETMRFDDIMKNKVVSGLQHDTEIRSKLLKRVDQLDFKALKAVISEIEAARKMSDAVDKRLVNQVNQVNVNALSTYQRDRDNTRHQSYMRGSARGGRARPYQKPQIIQPRPQPQQPQQQPQNQRLKCRACGYFPFFRCNKPGHFKGDRQAMEQKYANAIARPKIRAIEDSGYVDRIDEQHYVESITVEALDVHPVSINNTFDRDDNGLPIMPNSHQSPLIYCLVKNDPGTVNPTVQPQPWAPFEMVCLPDSGAWMPVLHEELAKEANLIINTNDVHPNISAANSGNLPCIGSTNVILKYKDHVIRFKAYVVRNVSKRYMYLSWKEMKSLNLLPQEYPLPLDEVNHANLLTAPPLQQDLDYFQNPNLGFNAESSDGISARISGHLIVTNPKIVHLKRKI